MSIKKPTIGEDVIYYPAENEALPNRATCAPAKVLQVYDNDRVHLTVFLADPNVTSGFRANVQHGQAGNVAMMSKGYWTYPPAQIRDEQRTNDNARNGYAAETASADDHLNGRTKAFFDTSAKDNSGTTSQKQQTGEESFNGVQKVLFGLLNSVGIDLGSRVGLSHIQIVKIVDEVTEIVLKNEDFQVAMVDIKKLNYTQDERDFAFFQAGSVYQMKKQRSSRFPFSGLANSAHNPLLFETLFNRP